jgi:hypothetical protein
MWMKATDQLDFQSGPLAGHGWVGCRIGNEHYSQWDTLEDAPKEGPAWVLHVMDADEWSNWLEEVDEMQNAWDREEPDWYRKEGSCDEYEDSYQEAAQDEDQIGETRDRLDQEAASPHTDGSHTEAISSSDLDNARNAGEDPPIEHIREGPIKSFMGERKRKRREDGRRNWRPRQDYHMLHLIPLIKARWLSVRGITCEIRQN